MEKSDKQNKEVTIEEIKKVLPHRFPMCLIDVVLEYEAGRFAIAKKAFSNSEPFFIGHYPKCPIVPGTILLESLSQTASFAILSSDIVGGGTLLFTGINRLRFYKPVVPGDLVVFKAEITKYRHGVWTVSGEGEVNGQICIDSEMSFVNKNDR